MNIRVLVFILSLLTSSYSLADVDDKECQEWTNKVIESPTTHCGACTQAKDFDEFNYRSGLINAFKSKKGLINFIKYTGRSTIMGAGADEQGCHLQTLLLKWGDKTFSNAATTAGQKAKVQVIGLLDYVAVPDFEKRFPKTYNLVNEHE